MLVQYLSILRHAPLWVPILGPQLRELAWRRAAADEVKQVMFDKTQDDLASAIRDTMRIDRDRLTHSRSTAAQTRPFLRLFCKNWKSRGLWTSPRSISSRRTSVSPLSKAARIRPVPEQYSSPSHNSLTFVDSAQTFSTIQAFFLAMSLNPSIQKKAQAELDAVIGPHRLPNYRDRASLPYVEAVFKESLRWHNVLPLGLQHCAGEDIEYRGYFIPRGTTFTANAWQVLSLL